MSMFVLEVIPALLGLFKTGSSFRKENGEQRDSALKAIYKACTETKLYVGDWERTGKRNRKREEILVNLWKEASIPVRHFDPALAEKCYYKGEDWLDPETWNDEDVKRLGIDLDRVIVEARDLKVIDDSEYEKKRLRPKNR